MTDKDIQIDSSLNELYGHTVNIDSSLLLLDSVLHTKTDKSYVDSSLYARDVSIAWLVDNITPSSLTQNYVDGSLNLRDISINNINTRINYIDPCLGTISSLALSTNSSMGIVYPLVFNINSSLGTITPLVYSNNASIGYLKTYTDGSLNTLNTRITNVNSSLNLYATNASVNNAVIVYATNASVGLALLSYATNASVNLVVGNIVEYVDGSLSTGLSTKLDNTTDTFTGLLTIDGSLHITGNIVQDGSIYVLHAENIETKADFITLREGATVQINDSSISGLKIMKADGTNNVIFGTGNDAILRIGWESDTLQAIATREDNPNDKYIAYWDDSTSMFKTTDFKSYVDNSLNARDISIYWLNDNKIDSTALYPYATNASVGLAIESSLTVLDNYVKSSSTGLGLYWNDGVIDVSISSASSIVQLTDVALTNIIDNQILVYDDASSLWVNKLPIDLSTYDVIDASDYFWIFSDVSITNPVNNQVLAYDSVSSKFKNVTVNASMYEIVNASDYVQTKIQMNSPSTGATGTAGDWCYDASYLYICTSTNIWMRILGQTGY